VTLLDPDDPGNATAYGYWLDGVLFRPAYSYQHGSYLALAVDCTRCGRRLNWAVSTAAALGEVLARGDAVLGAHHVAPDSDTICYGENTGTDLSDVPF
jgi:hypothetical protein